MAKTKRGLSETERAERRTRYRERLQQAAQALLTSDGWQRWVRARALFRNYSLLISGEVVIDAVVAAIARRRHVVQRSFPEHATHAGARWGRMSGVSG